MAVAADLKSKNKMKELKQEKKNEINKNYSMQHMFLPTLVMQPSSIAQRSVLLKMCIILPMHSSV
jgi:hypothetical protein